MTQFTMEQQGEIAIVTFANPPLDVMTPETINELNEMLPRLEEDDVGAVIFTGEGVFMRHFTAETLELGSKGDAALWDAAMDDVFYAIEHLKKPVISALNGSAFGGGLEFVLSTDIRVVKDGDARFGLPEITVGVLPGGGGTQRLTELVGRNRALDLIWRAKTLTPQQSVEYGLFQELVPADTDETALDRALTIANEILQHPALAIAHVKRLVRKAAFPVDKDALALESRLFAELMETPEARSLMRKAADAQKAAREAKDEEKA